MSLFPEPVVTQAEITAKEVRELNAWVQGTVQIVSERMREMFNRFWNNHNATPMQMCEAYGPYAILLFQKLAIWQGAMQQIDQSYVPLTVPERYTYTMGEDGTVTITEAVVEPPSVPPDSPV